MTAKNSVAAEMLDRKLTIQSSFINFKPTDLKWTLSCAGWPGVCLSRLLLDSSNYWCVTLLSSSLLHSCHLHSQFAELASSMNKQLARRILHLSLSLIFTDLLVFCYVSFDKSWSSLSQQRLPVPIIRPCLFNNVVTNSIQVSLSTGSLLLTSEHELLNSPCLDVIPHSWNELLCLLLQIPMLKWQTAVWLYLEMGPLGSNGIKNRTVMNTVGILFNETTEIFLTVFPLWEDTRELHHLQSSHRTQLCWQPVFGLPCFCAVKNDFLLLISPPVQGPALQQPESQQPLQLTYQSLFLILLEGHPLIFSTTQSNRTFILIILLSHWRLPCQ